MPASIFGNPAAVVQLNQALFGIAPGNGKYTNQLDQANAIGAIPFARQLGQTVAATNEALSATVLANLGIVNATLQTALAQAFAAFPNDRGVVVLNLTNILTTLEGNSVYGAAATQFNSQVATNFQYSTNSVNTADSAVNAGTVTLTANTDVITGNVFTAGLVFTPGGDDRINSLQDEDVLTGTGTNATLNATLGNANDNGGGVITPTLNNIATVNVAFTGSGALLGGGAANGPTNVLDLQDATGLVNLGITRISAGAGAAAIAAQNIQTAGTNNLSIAGVQVPATIFFDYADGALAAKDDAGTLNLASVNLQAVTIDQNAVNAAGGANEGFNTLTVRTTGANQVNNLISGETSVLNLAATGGSLSIANSTGNLLNVDRLGGAAVLVAAQPGTAVTIGAGEFQALGAASFANGGGVLSAINGSTSTGNLTVDITGYEAPRPNPQNSGVVVTTTVTGGSGNDRIISAGNIDNTGLVIDGGTGANTLALYNNLLDTVPTDNTRPTITNIQNLEVRTQTTGIAVGAPPVQPVISVDVSAIGGLQNIILRNETANGAVASAINLVELTQAQANAITINHGASRGNGINVNGAAGDGTTVSAFLNDASGTNDSVTLSLRTDLNNNNRFNVVLNADGNAAAATNAAATVTQIGANGQGQGVGTAGVENITINDTDNESNAIELTKGSTEHTGTITVNGGVAGQFMQLDATANAYRWDQSGNTVDGGTGSGGVTAINGRPTSGSRSDVDGGNAERLVAAVFDSSTYLGDVVIRVSDNAAATSLGGQRITFGAGNDTVIFDQITPGALNRNTAGLTISDTVAGGAGTDILGIDGNGVAVTITASEWTNVSGFEVIRTIGNDVASNNLRGQVNSYNLTLTNDLLANNGAQDGGVKRIIIVNDNDATNDAGQALAANSRNDNDTAANGATNNDATNALDLARNIALATGNEGGVTIDARTLSANNSFEYRGEEGAANANPDAGGIGNTSTADRFILADANINGGAIIDGGGASNVTTNTSIVGGAPVVAANGVRDVDSVRNADVLEVRNSATVSAGDLANITNVGTLEFTNDTAVAQNSILVIDDAIVDRMVDAYQASRVEANVGTATQVLQNQERLVVKAIDNINVLGATTGLTVQAGTLTGRSALDVFLGRTATHNIATGGGNDRVVLLGNYNTGTYAANAFGESIDALANNVAAPFAFTGTISLGGQTGIGRDQPGAVDVIGDTLTTYGAINIAGANITGLDAAIIANSDITMTEAQISGAVDLSGGPLNGVDIGEGGVAFTNATANHVLRVVDSGNANFDLAKVTTAAGTNVVVILGANVVANGAAAAGVVIGTAAPTNTILGTDAGELLTGTAAADLIVARGGMDTVVGALGNDTISLTETTAARDSVRFAESGAANFDTVNGFTAGAAATADVISLAGLLRGTVGLGVGNGDNAITNAAYNGATNMFAQDSDLVVFDTAIIGAISAASAATVIGTNNTPAGVFGAGVVRTYVVGNGTDSAVFAFTSVNGDGTVDANELSQVAYLVGVAQTALESNNFEYLTTV